jgi:hypothetical protein
MNKALPKSEIQVYAAVCLVLSAKMDMRTKPVIQEINENTGESFTNEQFASKEKEILSILSYRLVYPTPKLYQRWYMHKLCDDPQLFEITTFFSELALMKFDFIGWKASVVGLSSFLISTGCIDRLDLASKAMEVSRCTDKESVVQCVETMKAHAKRIIQAWDRPDSQPASKNVQDFFGHLDLGCNLVPIIMGG